MTELLDDAISRLRELPSADQDHAAAALMHFLDRREPAHQLTNEQRAEVARRVKGLADGTISIAADEEVEAMWRRFGA